MNGLILLLYCIEIMGALLCGAEVTRGFTIADVGNDMVQGESDKAFRSESSITTLVADLTSTDSTMSEASRWMNTESPAVSQFSNSHTTSPPPGPQPTTTHNSVFYRKECLTVFMVSGGLIIACVILLISTLLLACKVCQLSRDIKVLNSNVDLISNSEYRMGTKKNKSKSEAEATETSMLMAVVSQTQEEMGNSTTIEDGGKVNKDGQMGEENKKEVRATANSEEASTTLVTTAENSSSSKPQEEGTNSMAASSSEGTEEPKDVV
ncbi:uncharacterized protein LOC122888259 [Siniperca chuatsi]|uniref:uncharacterized protein LOC122888259 n=1 Tax=Siniperca chuatsi TaxID=119488 RepID=UPI001CE19C71|nr:uncharacterized protein LOC122888259 [Siniperca chuatsi]